MSQYREQLKRRHRRLQDGLLLAAVCALFLVGAAFYAPAALSVSHTLTEAAGREIPIYSVETPKKQIALSFDAAWGNEDTDRLLSILKKHQVTATFFMTGEWVSKYPEDVKAILAAGHDLGNHSSTHPNMSRLSREEIVRELQNTHQKVLELTDTSMTLFRPPFGDYDDLLIKTARECGYVTVQWNVDSRDWKDYSAADLVRIVCENKDLQNGSIVLMHNGGKYTADALEEIILNLKGQGYELVPISQLILTENYHIDHTGRQIPH